MNPYLIGGLVLLIIVIGAAVAALLPTPANVRDSAKFDRAFTAEEKSRIASVSVSAEDLAAATCEDGAKCWIAIDGVVYDVAPLPSWARGQHHGLTAGNDLTEKFYQSGHGVDHLNMLGVVGAYPSGVRSGDLK